MPGPALPSAFRALHRDLLRRRLASIEPRLRIEIAALALLVGAFLFWQARIAFASIAHDHGARAVAVRALLDWAAIVLGAGAWIAARHRRQLTSRAPGPAWLGLPIEPRAIYAHLAWEARTLSWWAVPAALPLVAAMAGLVPAWWIPILMALGALMLWTAGHAACAVAFALARRPATHAHLDPVTRRLAVAESGAGLARTRSVARWRRARLWAALWSKDLALTRRPGAARRRALPPLAFALGSVAVWTLPLEPAAAHVLGFGLALLAAGTFGEWLIALSGVDPVTAFRVLPVGLGALWTSRVAWVPIAIVPLLAAQAIAARALPLPALELFLIWIGIAALAIALLAVHYGITLYPHTEVAQRIYSLALGIAVATSLMIPMFGWLTLLTAVIHSTRRLARWSRLDPHGMMRVTDLTRRYGELLALDGVSFEVAAGEILGLLGPNGAGKSTLLRIASGLQAPDRGSVSIADADVWREPIAAKRQLGLAAEEPSFYEELSAEEYLAFLATVRDLEPEPARRRAADLLERLGLAGRHDEPVSRYSHGMRKKISFIAAVLHRPAVLLCDEALEGFDVSAALEAKAEIRALAAHGASVLFSSHVTETIERLCDRALILHRGRVARSLERAAWGNPGPSLSPLETAFLAAIRSENV